MVREKSPELELSLDSFPRLSFLYKGLLDAKKEVCVQRARYLTQYMRGEHVWFDPPLIRRAQAVAHVLRNIDVEIRPDELLAGSISTKRIGAVVYPELSGLLIWPELDRLSGREGNSLQITDADRRELENDIFPYWQGKAVMDYAEAYTSPPAPITLLGMFGVYMLTEAGGISHTSPDYPRLVEVGLEGIIREAGERLEEIDTGPAEYPSLLRKRSFYKAVQIVCQAAIDYAHRCRDEALKLAAGVADPERKAELQEIARICDKVPAKPAETFHEAVQSIWLVQVALHQENYEQAICLGRLDQYLYPYYKRDIEKGILTEHRAIELLGCLFIKYSEFVPLFCDGIAQFFEGFPAMPALTIGGLTADGDDATNELSHRILDTRELIATRHPNIHARIHRDSPQDYLKRVSEVIKRGSGYPALLNDNVVVPALETTGITLEDARDYVIIGCVETSVPYKTFGSTDAALMSLPACLEMALNDGYMTVLNQRVGLATGDSRDFNSMDDVIDAFRKQVSFVVEQMVIGLNALSIAHEEQCPSPLLSSVMGGCMENGRDVTAGGAEYNFTGVQGVGTADVADSLAAIDRLVFAEKRVTMEELLQALKDNFAGHEALHEEILKVAKYGNDHDLADKYARIVSGIYCREVAKHPNSRGGAYLPGHLSMTCHKAFGQFCGALPSGRRAMETFANGISPSDGWDRKGPTAALKSVAKVDYSLATNGVAVNLKFHPQNLRGDNGTHVLTSLVRTYFDMGGMHLQVNVVDRETLLDAQAHPDNYPALMVRVAGYSAYFCDLTRRVQDEIIARTEHGCPV